MAEAETLQRKLLEAQNRDGGWGYQKGSSWTEPTALAVLALAALGARGAAGVRGGNWLMGTQKRDGGWAPQPAVDRSTWVTSLAALALSGNESGARQYQRGICWLLSQREPDEMPVGRLLARLRGMVVDPRPAGGSPWFPGTAAWISPTAASIFALSECALRDCALSDRDGGQCDRRQLRARLSESQEFILARRCRDGGWNHGGSRYQSENASSYPETTGMALLALRGVKSSQLLFPLARAVDFLPSPGSIEALSWLQLGLLAHGRDYRAIQTDLPCRTVRDLSLRLLALAGKSGSNKLLSA